MYGGGALIGHSRFYIFATVVGLIFSAAVAVASTTIGTNIITTDGTLTVTSLSTFGNASSTLLSATNGLWVGSSGATSIFGSATSTFGAGISATYLNLSGTSASSTAANGINLTAGCFAVNGTCLGVNTTASNTWGGTQTFTNNPILGSLTGLIAGNSGTLYQVASSSIFGFTPISNALTKGYFLVGNDAGTAQATSTISISSTGDITPAKRLILPMGEINYFNTTGILVSIVTQSNGSTNLVKVAPGTSLSADGYEFDNGGADNGRLRYTGATTKMFHTAFTISMDGEGNGTNLYVFGIAKNGVVGDCKVIQSIAVANDTQSTALHCMVSLATNDYIELYVGNLTDADDITAKTVNLFAMGL